MSSPLPPLPAAAALLDAAEALRARAKALVALAGVVEDAVPAKVAAAHARVEAAPGANLRPEAAVAAWLEAEAQGRRARLAAELRAGCDARGIDASVLTRAPLTLRVAPFHLAVDVDADTAELGFGRAPLGQCRADAAEILALHGALLDGARATALPALHAQLRTAWTRAGGGRDGQWVPLAEVFSALAWLRQPARFHRAPSARSFVDYPRAAFVFDLWRLREGRLLDHAGWRLGLGTAAGDSMRDRSQVFWLEDAQGRGQWHHTLRFTRSPAP